MIELINEAIIPNSNTAESETPMNVTDVENLGKKKPPPFELTISQIVTIIRSVEIIIREFFW
jgi:hypothetical protein